MRQNLFKIGILFFILVLSNKISAQQVEFEDRQGFGVSPLSIFVDAQPGSRSNSKITIITRNTRQSSRFSIRVMDLGQMENGNKKPVDIGTGTRSAADWISVEQEIIIEPNSKKEIPFTINVPRTANGAYFAYLNVRLLPDQPEARIAAILQPSAVSEIAVYTRSQAPLHVDVKDVSIVSGDLKNIAYLVLHAKNTGVWKSTLEGDILLYRERGTFPIRIPIVYGKGEIPLEIYPECEVTMRCPIVEIPPPGLYKVSARLILNGKYLSVNHLEIQIPESLYGGTVTGRMISKSESDLDVLVMPSMAELTILPGARRTVPIRIQNRDQRTIRVQARITEAKMETNGQLTFSEGSTINNDWISISPLSLELGQRRTGVVKAQITVPSDASEIGALLYAVRINISGPSADDEWDSASEHGVLLVASEPRALPGKLEVSKLELIRSAVNANPSTAVVDLKNVGEKVARYRGEIVLERISGQSIANMQIGGTGQEEIILPGTHRVYRMVLPPVDEGDFRVRTAFTTLGNTRDRIVKEETFTSVAEIPVGL